MSRSMVAALIALLVSGCAGFPTCQNVIGKTGWSEVPASDETDRVRETAASAGVLDHGSSWGEEFWFTDARGNYLMCANECPNPMRNVRYSVLFQRTDDSWTPRWEQDPACRR